jgi:hypothetical protein
MVWANPNPGTAIKRATRKTVKNTFFMVFLLIDDGAWVMKNETIRYS